MKGHTKDKCRKLEAKNKNSQPKYQKNDHKGKSKGISPDILEVHTQHLGSCECSFPKHVLGPNDLLRAIGHINGTPVHILLDSSSSHNFVDDQLVQTLGLRTRLSDHTYRVHLAGGGIQYINGAVHQVPVHIDSYVEKLDFHVMKLRSADVILGYPWFYNKNSSLSIDWINHSMTFVLNDFQHFIQCTKVPPKLVLSYTSLTEYCCSPILSCVMDPSI